jgi:hypothetical protein
MIRRLGSSRGATHSNEIVSTGAADRLSRRALTAGLRNGVPVVPLVITTRTDHDRRQSTHPGGPPPLTELVILLCIQSDNARGDNHTPLSLWMHDVITTLDRGHLYLLEQPQLAREA